MNKHNCKTIITFTDPIEKALFDEEISGQLSDGYWENTRNTDWLWGAETKLGDKDSITVTPSYTVGKTSYGFSKVVEYVGDRMVEIGKKFDPDYNEKKLRKNLKNIGRIIKMAREA